MSNTKRMNAKEQPEAIRMLVEDHREVEKLAKQFEKLGDDATDEKLAIIERVCKALTVHAQLEEELFYPAIEKHIKDGDMVSEAFVEHQSFKDLIAKLQSGSLEEEERDATFTVLCEYVEHHVEEEESELFPEVKRAKGVDLEMLGAEMAERKPEIAEEVGIDATEEAPPARPRKAGTRSKSGSGSHAHR